MKLRVFSLYNKVQRRYGLPFFGTDDADAIDRVVQMVCSQSDPALLVSLDGLSLVSLGAFMSELREEYIKPLWSNDEHVVILDDLHKNLPLPPTIKERIDKYYGGNANA